MTAVVVLSSPAGQEKENSIPQTAVRSPAAHSEPTISDGRSVALLQPADFADLVLACVY